MSKPDLVLIVRNTPGSAFTYTRYTARERRETWELAPVDVGVTLPHLTASEVERIRTGRMKADQEVA